MRRAEEPEEGSAALRKRLGRSRSEESAAEEPEERPPRQEAQGRGRRLEEA